MPGLAFGRSPEINDMLLKSGLGAAAHAPAIAGYTALAAHYGVSSITQAATAFATAPGFVGLAGTASMASALPQSAWQAVAGTHAATAAANITEASLAYQLASSLMIPAARCISNRVETATLIATNFLGMNTPAIVQHEVEYQYYWQHNAHTQNNLGVTLTGLGAALAAPLPPSTEVSNPAPTGTAGIGAAGFGAAALSVGLGAAGAAGGIAAGVGGGVSAGVGAATGLSTGVGSSLASTLPGIGMPANIPATAGDEGTSPVTLPQPVQPGAQPAPAITAMPSSAVVSPPAPTGSASSSAPLTKGVVPSSTAPVAGSGTSGSSVESLSGVMQPLMEAPQQLAGSLASPLQGATSLAAAPAMMLASLAGLTSGMNPTKTPTTTPTGLQGTRLSLSGMGEMNGGYAAGGSVASAAFTEPMDGAPGLPAGWGTPAETQPAFIGADASGASAASDPGAPIGMLPPVAGARRDDNAPIPPTSPAFKMVVSPMGGAALN